MSRHRVMVIGLDGLEARLAERLADSGEMPALRELGRRSARYRLNHGSAQRTGLAWEHVASGLSPEDAHRWAAVEFDPATYRAWYEGARFTPWWAGLDRRVVVFDTPYVDVRRAPNTRGVVGWGCHDPGTLFRGRPNALPGEFEARFGTYPASRWIYGLPWPSAERTRAMGEALSQALEVRSRAALWLATERFPDWDLFFAVAGEPHGAVEGLWHGVDASHPLHGHVAAPAAGKAMLEVHRALDRVLGKLVSAAGDAAVIAFAMGGMGPNHSDVASMVLLPELLYRSAFGRPLLDVPAKWTAAPDTVPNLEEDEDWSRASQGWVPRTESRESRTRGALRSVARGLPRPVRDAIRQTRGAVADWRRRNARIPRGKLDFQPALRYRPHWSRMPAFALPSFYDGRIRLNLKGREKHGMIEASRYDEACGELETMLRECRDPRTGLPAVDSIERAWTRDPLSLGGSESDLLVIWRGVVAGLEHPRLGLIGPVPLRRTGGHTGPHGMAYVAAPGFEPGERGVRSAFDVVPTIAKLLGDRPPSRVSGEPLA